MKGTTTGVWMNGMMKGEVLDGMKTANGCDAHSQAHFPLDTSEKGDSGQVGICKHHCYWIVLCLGTAASPPSGLLFCFGFVAA